MISHEHKIIFIHIPKCAGSSIETAFGIDVINNNLKSDKLFGWDNKNKFYLQHATPQQLLDCQLISPSQWNSYYKFIIVRNTWDKVISDFYWFKETKKFIGTFYDYLYCKNDFKRFMKVGEASFRGDHLNAQVDYMYLNSKLIKYDKIIFYDKNNLDFELSHLANDLGLSFNFFKNKIQVRKKNKKHYSKYYTNKMKSCVLKKYERDIQYFNFNFEDKRSILGLFKKI
jgi:hypothetical protein